MDLKHLKKTLNDNIELILKELGVDYEIFNNNIYSTCPIHEDSDNPRAFSFSIDKGIWKCWTRDCQCEHGHDVFGLITGALSAKEGKQLEFKDALRWSCKILNIDNKYSPNNTDATQEDEQDVMFELLKHLKKKPKDIVDKEITEQFSNEVPSDYFNGRGFRKSTLKYFQVGDCYEQGIMKERSIIPIHNHDGKKLVGMICRSIKEYKTPKFLIYPTGFDKNSYFYNYHRAIKKSKETSCLYILEGQGDVWRMHEAGVKNAVSVFGKSLSEQHIRQLYKLPITRLIIIMDNDQAGREASVKMQRQLGRMYKLTFPRLSNKDVVDMKVANIQKNILSNLGGTY